MSIKTKLNEKLEEIDDIINSLKDTNIIEFSYCQNPQNYITLINTGYNREYYDLKESAYALPQSDIRRLTTLAEIYTNVHKLEKIKNDIESLLNKLNNKEEPEEPEEPENYSSFRGGDKKDKQINTFKKIDLVKIAKKYNISLKTKDNVNKNKKQLFDSLKRKKLI
jgi:hypothetical protein